MTTASNPTIDRAGYQRAAALLKVLSHPDRLQILYFVEDLERNVTQIQKHVDLTQAMTSQHLKVLFETGYVDRRRSTWPVSNRTHRAGGPLLRNLADDGTGLQ